MSLGHAYTLYTLYIHVLYELVKTDRDGSSNSNREGLQTVVRLNTDSF